MKTTAISVILVAVMAVAACSSGGANVSGSDETPLETRNVLVSLDWIIGGQHAPFFVAVDKGFYADEGIEAEITRGYGSGDTVRRVASAKADFGFADSGPLISAAAEAVLGVRAVAALYGEPPHAIFYNEDSKITTPKDLEGKTLADSASSAVRLLWPAFARANGIDMDKVRWQIVDPTAVTPSLLSKSVDGVGQFTVSSVTLHNGAEAAGMKIGRMLYSDHGLSFYGNSLLARDETIKDDPDLVRRFVAATIKGYEYALEHQDEAIEIFHKYQSDVNPKVAAEELRLVSELVLTDEASKHGIGHIDPDRWEETFKLLSEGKDVGAVTAEDLYTTEFLPEPGN